jgi:hypothetical protein
MSKPTETLLIHMRILHVITIINSAKWDKSKNNMQDALGDAIRNDFPNCIVHSDNIREQISSFFDQPDHLTLVATIPNISTTDAVYAKMQHDGEVYKISSKKNI